MIFFATKNPNLRTFYNQFLNYIYIMKKFILTTAIFFSVSAYAQNKKGLVIGITDGDTVKVLTDTNDTLKCRLAEIDAPERKQEFGRESKEHLSDLLYKKNIEYNVVSKDGYGRSVTKIYINGKYVSLLMIEQGLAWHYAKYSSSKDLSNAQSLAKEKKIGVWSVINPQTPWDYRIEKKNK